MRGKTDTDTNTLKSGQELNQKMSLKVINLAGKLAQKKGRRIRIMEVCGTHTVAFARTGLTQLVSEYLDLRSGPGCPVCVTHQNDLDHMIALASLNNTIIVTFGDLIRVPGSLTTLEKEKARGAHIHICYSPMEAIDICAKNPQKEVILLGIGFETTTPPLASTVLNAHKKNLSNFSITTALKMVPPALDALFGDIELEHSIDGLILPGHVAVVLGRETFAYLASAYQMPSVITGFEPFDLLAGLYSLLNSIDEENAQVLNLYSHVVKETGNQRAKEETASVFEKEPVTNWRGLGSIPGSGLKLKESYSHFDAKRKFKVNIESSKQKTECRCGEIITGKMNPLECILFNKVCTPLNPIGPCMVSQEGACSAYHKYLS